MFQNITFKSSSYSTWLYTSIIWFNTSKFKSQQDHTCNYQRISFLRCVIHCMRNLSISSFEFVQDCSLLRIGNLLTWDIIHNLSHILQVVVATMNIVWLLWPFQVTSFEFNTTFTIRDKHFHFFEYLVSETKTFYNLKFCKQRYLCKI